MLGLTACGWVFVLSVIVATTGCGGCGSGSQSSDSQDDTQSIQSSTEGLSLPLVDITNRTTVSASYRNGKEGQRYTMLETLGGGVAMVDFDRDGRSDLFFPGGGSIDADLEIGGARSTFWHNRDGEIFDDQSDTIGIDTTDFYSHGAFAADFNRDGFRDLLVSGYGGVRLYTNMGDGTFVPKTDSGLPTDRWCSCAVWGDFNHDGELDLFVVNYLKWDKSLHRECEGPGGVSGDVCSPKDFAAEDDRLYLGQGDGTFVDASEQSGIVAGGKGLGVMAADIDRDGDLDIYVANDTTPNFLYLNDGSGNFEECGSIRGVAVDAASRANGSMGVALGDFNVDGLPDIGVSNFDHESYAIYRQEAGFVFFPAADLTGMTQLGGNAVSWGTCFFDVDADGREDLIVSNGHILYHPNSGEMAQSPLVAMNRDGRFERARFDDEHYLTKKHYGRGLAVGDLDRNGRPEFVFSNVNENAAILSLRPDTDEQDEYRFVFVELIGQECNRDGLGAVVEFKTDKRTQHRAVVSSGSYLSSSENGVVFGLPAGESAQSFTIHWPGGSVQTIDFADAAEASPSYYQIVEDVAQIQ